MDSKNTKFFRYTQKHFRETFGQSHSMKQIKKFTFRIGERHYLNNKTGTSKVGAISKAQKAQKTFLKKNLKFLNFFLSENVA